MGNRRGKRERPGASGHLVAAKPSREPSRAPLPAPELAKPDGRHEAASARIALDEDTQANLRLTRWLVRWTAALAIVGIVTAIVGGITASVGYVQWKALLKTDSTTREAFTAVQRPFMIAMDLEIAQDLPIYWKFRTILENTGSTPTKNMTVTSSVSFSVPIVPDSPTDPFDLRRQPGEAYPTITDHFLGPHGTLRIEGISLTTKTLEDMAAARSDFYIYGVARYNDQFSETEGRLTKFCFVVRPFKGPSGLALNNYGLCHHWNCGDADCDRDKRNYEMDRNEILKRSPNAAEISRPVPIGAIVPFYPTPVIKAQ